MDRFEDHRVGKANCSCADGNLANQSFGSLSKMWDVVGDNPDQDTGIKEGHIGHPRSLAS